MAMKRVQQHQCITTQPNMDGGSWSSSSPWSNTSGWRWRKRRLTSLPTPLYLARLLFCAVDGQSLASNGRRDGKKRTRMRVFACQTMSCHAASQVSIKKRQATAARCPPGPVGIAAGAMIKILLSSAGGPWWSWCRRPGMHFPIFTRAPPSSTGDMCTPRPPCRRPFHLSIWPRTRIRRRVNPPPLCSVSSMALYWMYP